MSKLAEFSVPAALALADQILAAPPGWPFVERVTPKGALVARFVLPLELLEPQNRRHRAPQWLGPQQRERCYRLLVLQARTLRYPAPLQGRPQLLCVRFSCVPSDAYSDGFKLAIDRLCAPKGRAKMHRLGLIVDDGPQHVEVHQWCEKAPRGKGFGMIAVYAGDERAALPATPKRRKGRAA